MNRIVTAATLIAAVTVAACSSYTTSAQQSPTPGPQATPTPTLNPNPNFKQSPLPSCNSPLPSFQYLDANSNYQPLDASENDVWSSNDTVDYFAPYPIFPPVLIRQVKPRIPVLALEYQLYQGESASLEIVPDQTLAAGLIQHYKYEAALDKADRYAASHGIPPPVVPTSNPSANPPGTPSPAEVDARFVSSALPVLQREDWGGSYDDQIFAQDNGNPDNQNPHTYAMLCEYLTGNVPYTLVMHILRTAQDKNDPLYKATLQTLFNDPSNHAPSDAADNVGYKPVESDYYAVTIPWVGAEEPSKVTDQTQRRTVLNDMWPEYQNVSFGASPFAAQLVGPYPSAPPTPTPVPSVVNGPT